MQPPKGVLQLTLTDYPNEEILNGFAKSLVSYFIVKSGQRTRFSVQRFVKAVTSGDIDAFMKMMETMIAGVPYSEKGSPEAHFQNACHLLFILMGQFLKLEDRTSDGRIDLTVETPHHVYIFEFKTDSSAEEALAQIHRKKYWLKYRGSNKKITLIGANFDTRTRRLSAYRIETSD